MSDDLKPFDSVAPQPTAKRDPRTEIEMVAASLRADATDTASLGRVLLNNVAGLLPAGLVTLTRERSLADRIAKREGQVVAADVTFGEVGLGLRSGKTGVVAQRRHIVRGVVLSRSPLSLDAWILELAEQVSVLARADATARAALERMLGLAQPGK